MALDEALARGCDRGAPASLRFYAWQRPTLSIGRHQRLDAAADPESCRRLGLDLVRRPTGGRAVLHEHEVTYALTLPPGEPLLADGFRRALAKIARALARGLRSLGVPAEVASRGEAGPGRGAGPVLPCFLLAAREEVVVGGLKVGGSAQWRLPGGALLQHGSIPLRLDARRLLEATGSRGGRVGGAAPAPSCSGIARWTGEEGSAPHRVIRALVEGVEEEVGVRLLPGDLRAPEIDAARRLADEVYGCEAWLRRI